MITFLICLVVLVAAYFLYGRYLEKVCKINPQAAVPSKALYDGVDYVPMPQWKTFLVQLLNIAGIGPIFGAILGACFGPVAFLWITIGGIFMGAMHDFLSGVILVRNEGLSIPEIVVRYLGTNIGRVMRVFSLILLVLVGVVFMRSPASIISGMIGEGSYWWILGVIVVYYFVATLLPVDKIIGKLYPLFGAALVAMALCMMGVILFGDYTVPELNTFANFQLNKESMPIVPTIFFTITCGAISGFHATQSPMMARCINSESECRMVFYGSMIAESVIALIWAAVAMAFFGGEEGGLAGAMAANGNNAAWAVNTISRTTLGTFGGILTVLGVVAAPITSGDTAFRSARLTIADMFHIDQSPKLNRLVVSGAIFAVAMVLMFVDFDIIWRYFSWSNQVLAGIVLWCIVAYLYKQHVNYWLALIPALFMTYMCATFMFVSNQFLGLGTEVVSYVGGGVLTIVVSALLLRRIVKESAKVAK